MGRLFSVVIGWACVTGPAFAQAQFPYEAKIKELAAPYFEHHVLQSAVIGVTQGDKSWSFAFGTLEPDVSNQPNEDSIFEIGSISKVFTGILLADAIVQKKIAMDQSIANFLPAAAKQNSAIKPITFQQLSQHMSGLPRMPSNIAPADVNNPFADYDRSLLHAYLAQWQPTRDPGTQHEYSNLAVGLLGDLLAEHAGKTYEALLKERLLEPLNMNDTCVQLTDSANAKLAPPMTSALTKSHSWDFKALAGAGGIRSSMKDMLRFVHANLKPSESELGKAMELAWQQSLPAEKDHRAMGLGWMIAGDGSTRWHNGQTGGYQSMILVNRELKTGVVLLSNTSTMEADALAESIFQAVVGMDVKPRSFDKEVQVSEQIVQRLVGEYELAPGAIFTITANGNRLMAQLTGQPALRVFPESDTIWNYREVAAQLRFELPSEGSATSVTLYQNGNVLPAKRK